ncbi:DUF29 domain-containing protein [Halochromatium roseum]|uniref:DUF29 domain-containing protein n=1 Tax=Halochromatium roseum TaxID=391920 RepID=UPI00191434D6|nr:DUF29 domain-containing protein [Halochromatium roseum]MBK5941947.1 hypothetical protein [Halochromatium roseum]
MQATHDGDYYAWALEAAEHLRAGRLSEVDLNGVAEELEDMGKAQRHALASHLKVLIVHLLKWRYQPGFRGVSWRLSIANARDEIAELLEDSPSLRPKLAALVERRYPAARNRAALETGLAEETFPSNCPFSEEELLDVRYWPE